MTDLDLELVGTGTRFSSDSIPAASSQAFVNIDYVSSVHFSLQVRTI